MYNRSTENYLTVVTIDEVVKVFFDVPGVYEPPQLSPLNSVPPE